MALSLYDIGKRVIATPKKLNISYFIFGPFNEAVSLKSFKNIHWGKMWRDVFNIYENP